MLAVAILAAGKGTRMRSTLPKVLHKLNGKSILSRVVDTCFELNPDKVFIIVGIKMILFRNLLKIISLQTK